MTLQYNSYHYVDRTLSFDPYFRQRPYHAECPSSRPITDHLGTLGAVDIQTFSDLGRNLLDNSICDTCSQLGMTESGEVSRALRYCNTKPTRDRTGASS